MEFSLKVGNATNFDLGGRSYEMKQKSLVRSLCCLKEIFLFLFKLQKQNDFEQDNENQGWPLSQRGIGWSLHLCLAGYFSITCPISRKARAASEAQPNTHISRTSFLFFHSTTNLENLPIIQTVFSIWTALETLYLS